MQSVDVLVAGAGPAGALTSLLLARRGASVVCVDRLRSGRAVGEHLPAIARRLLRTCNLEGLLAGHASTPGLVSAWSGPPVAQSALNDPYGPGLVLDRARFDAELRETARDAGVRFVDGWLRQVVRRDPGFQVTGAFSGQAQVVIDATGRSAVVARQLGAQVLRDHRAVAWCRWQADVHADRRVWVENGADGWWYTAPLPGGERVVMWHRQVPDAVSVDDFGRALDQTRHVSTRCAGAWRPGITARAAGGQVTEPPCGLGWCAVGDAALAFDPISSQGVYTALFGALQVVESLSGDPISSADFTPWSVRVQALREVYLQRHGELSGLLL